MQLRRRTVNDLITRYELEPGLRDIYVEGDFDRDLISECLRKKGADGVAVYAIDTVEILDSTLLSFGLTRGNKPETIALAKILSRLSDRVRYYCIVDRDLDHWFGDLERVRGLLWT